MTTLLYFGASPVGLVNATPDQPVIDALKRLPVPEYPPQLQAATRAAFVEQIKAGQAGSNGLWELGSKKWFEAIDEIPF